LQTLIEAADSVVSGHYDEHVAEVGADEVSLLARNFNRMSTAVQLREQKLVAIFNAVPVPMALLSRTGTADTYRVDDMNQAAKVVFSPTETTHNDALVNPLSKFLQPQDAARFSIRLARHEMPEPLEAPMLAGDGTQLQCLVTGGVFDIAGVQYMAMAMIDVTKLRTIEGQLRVLNADLEQRVEQRTKELASRNVDLALSIDRLQTTQQQLVQSEKLSGLGKIVIAVAHELNTPIGSALTASTTLQARDAEFRKLMDTGMRRSELHAFLADNDLGLGLIVRNLERAAGLVMSFKTVAVDRTHSKRGIFQLRDVIDTVVALVMPDAANKRISIQTQLDGDIEMDSYPSVLEQVLLGILNNAMRHAFEGMREGEIRITALCRNADVVLQVVDNGSGIAPEHLSKVFDPFFTTRLGQGSSGLGLNIVYNLVSGILGGSVSATSPSGEGACFAVTIPLHAPGVG